MRKLVMVGVLTLMLCGTAEAGVTDWPVGGQVVRVGQWVVGGSGTLIASLFSHLKQWGTEVVQTVGQCAIHTTTEVTDVAEDVVSLSLPTPDPQPTEVPDEVPSP